MAKALDRFDVALLNLLQANNLATAEALTLKVPLSASAITRRIRRLRDDGLMVANVAILSPALVEDRLRAVVHIQVHDHAEDQGLAALRTRLAAAPEVQLLLNIAGPFDLLAVVVARSMAAFNTFADTYFAADPTVRRYETSFVKKQIKNSPAVWLDDADWQR